MKSKIFDFISEKKLWPIEQGIYRIICIPTGKIYVGKAGGVEGFRTRWNHHRNNLKRLIHHNKYLQRAYNKYGEKCFLFEVLETNIDPINIPAREIYWIEFYQSLNSNKGYNLAVVKEGDIDKNYNIKNFYSKKFRFLSPDGNIIEGVNVSKFVKTLGVGFDVSCFLKLLSGKIASYKGYRNADTIKFKIKKQYRILSPNLQLFVFDNLWDFAKKIGVSDTQLGQVFKNRRAHCKGWHLENPTKENRKLINIYLNGHSVVMDNKIHRFRSGKAFAIKYKFPYHHIYIKFLDGKRQEWGKLHNLSLPTKEQLNTLQIIHENF